MAKNEYLINLAVELEKGGVGADEIKRTVEFCSEMMDDMMEDGMTEEQAVSSMGEPSEIALRMKEEGMPEAVEEPAAEEASASGEDSQRIHKIFEPSSIKEIYVIDDNNGVSMVPGTEFSVDYTQVGEDKYIARVENGVLTVRFVDGRRKLGFLQRLFCSHSKREKVVVTVPYAWRGGASLRTSNAPIEVRDVQLSSLVAHTSNSRATAENVKTQGAVVIKTSNSQVTAEKLEAAEVTMKTSNGHIEAKEVRVQGSITCVTSNGRVNAENVSAKEAVLSTSNGRIVVQNIGAEYIKLATSNGGISGIVAGKREDYRISSRTSNGKNSLGSSGDGQRILEAITSNGVINIEFSE